MGHKRETSQVSSLPCCSSLSLWWRFPPSDLSWFTVLMMLRVYLTTLLLYCAPPLLIAHWIWEVTLSPCPHHPTWEIPIPPPPALRGVQTTNCHRSHKGHNTETENWEEWIYFSFIFCNLVQLNPNIKNIFKQKPYWEQITGHSAKATSDSDINAFC